MRGPKPKRFPCVTQEAYHSALQSLLEENQNDNFIELVLGIMKKENPILANFLIKVMQNLEDLDSDECKNSLLISIFIMYLLLRNQSQADEMNEEMI